MKNNIKSFVFLFVSVCLVFISGLVIADPPGPPADHGSSGNQDPGPVGAPIDGGLGILVVLIGSAGYGGFKLYKIRKKEMETEELKS